MKNHIILNTILVITRKRQDISEIDRDFCFAGILQLTPVTVPVYANGCELLFYGTFSLRQIFSTLLCRVLKIHILFIKRDIIVHISEGKYKQKQAIQTISHEYEWR